MMDHRSTFSGRCARGRRHECVPLLVSSFSNDLMFDAALGYAEVKELIFSKFILGNVYNRMTSAWLHIPTSKPSSLVFNFHVWDMRRLAQRDRERERERAVGEREKEKQSKIMQKVRHAHVRVSSHLCFI